MKRPVGVTQAGKRSQEKFKQPHTHKKAELDKQMLGKNTETVRGINYYAKEKEQDQIHFQNRGDIFIQKISLLFLPHILKGGMIKGRICNIFCYALDTVNLYQM